MVLFVQLLSVVIPRKSQYFRALLSVFSAHLIGAYRDISVATRVVLPHKASHERGKLLPVLVRAGIGYLVADAPPDQARVIAVAAHPRRYITLPPFFRETNVVKLGLGVLPNVCELRQNQKSHFIA